MYIKRIFEENALRNVFLATSLPANVDRLNSFMFVRHVDFANDNFAICLGNKNYSNINYFSNY